MNADQYAKQEKHRLPPQTVKAIRAAVDLENEQNYAQIKQECSQPGLWPAFKWLADMTQGQEQGNSTVWRKVKR